MLLDEVQKHTTLVSARKNGRNIKKTVTIKTHKVTSVSVYEIDKFAKFDHGNEKCGVVQYINFHSFTFVKRLNIWQSGVFSSNAYANLQIYNDIRNREIIS